MSGHSVPPDGNRRSPARAVIEAVATAEGVEPDELPPIYDAIEPEALDSLFAGRDSSAVRIDFRYAGHDVTLEGNGEVGLEVDINGTG